MAKGSYLSRIAGTALTPRLLKPPRPLFAPIAESTVPEIAPVNRMNVPTAAPLAQAARTTTPPVSISTFQPKQDAPLERAEVGLEQQVTQAMPQLNMAMPPVRKSADVDEPVVREVPATNRADR